MASYCGRFKMHVINLLPIQEQIVHELSGGGDDDSGADRFMMRIAERIAEKRGCVHADHGRKPGAGGQPDGRGAGGDGFML